MTGWAVWLWYDWRAAAVADENGRLLDELLAQPRSVAEVVTRLDLVEAGGLTDEARALLERFPAARPRASGAVDLPAVEWPLPDAEALALLDQAALVRAERGVDAAAADPDRRLEHLVRATEEARAHLTTTDGRMVEWLALFLPNARVAHDRRRVARDLLDAAVIEALAASWDVDAPPAGPEAAEWLALQSLATSVFVTDQRVTELEAATRELVREHLPSVSTLVGPLLAARLCVAAGGRSRLARLPSGTVQVLGAESALFMHLHGGATPPKHGHIFQHPWVHRSPRGARGRVARFLAGRISIAARIDAFDGDPLGDEAVAKVEARVGAIRESVLRR